MIIKSLSRTSGSGNAGQLINYILRYIVEKEPKEQPEKEARHSVISKEQVPLFMEAFKEGKLDFAAIPYTEISAFRELIERSLDESIRIAKDTEIGKELVKREKENGVDLRKTTLHLTPNHLISRSKHGERFYKLSAEILQPSNKSSIKQKSEGLILTKNMRARSTPGYVQAFQKLEDLRINVRQNQVQIYHHIISFSSQENKDLLTDEVLKDLAEKFMELRGPNNIFVGAPHYDRDHVHLHLAMSAVDIAGRSSRISKGQFAELKTELQRYQMERYPELNHSLPEHGKKLKEIRKDNIENAIKIRRTSEKEQLLRAVENLLPRATSSEHFLSQLRDIGFTPYFRSGRLTGVITEGNRKFRFSTLGFNLENLKTLDTLKEKEKNELSSLQKLREDSSKERTTSRLDSINQLAEEMNTFELDLENSISSQEKNSDRPSEEKEVEMEQDSEQELTDSSEDRSNEDHER